ncbi:MAG: helix-turn-helix transcriptional regulator [Eubacterium sp.]|jgi:PadR family transcriptional regulator PadR|nr:helix-turn-helix transcriptional regulator [Eubacterium sp.]
MIYPLNPALMELLVLAMISQQDSYGYQISQQIKSVSNLKDSTLYPVLRRLAENCYVDIYDQQFQGRNRKYYRITEAGRQRKEFLETEWKEHIKAVLEILESSSPVQEQQNMDGSDAPEGGNDE